MACLHTRENLHQTSDVIAKRFNAGKPQLSRIRGFPVPIETLARVMELGAAKYGDDNWKIGGKPDQEYLDSFDRHMAAWLAGEKFDPDSGCSHLGHALWNLLALHQLNHPDEIYNEVEFNKRIEYWQNESV